MTMCKKLTMTIIMAAMIGVSGQVALAQGGPGYHGNMPKQVKNVQHKQCAECMAKMKCGHCNENLQAMAIMQHALAQAEQLIEKAQLLMKTQHETMYRQVAKCDMGKQKCPKKAEYCPTCGKKKACESQSRMQAHHKQMHRHQQAMMQCEMGKKMGKKMQAMACPLCAKKKKAKKDDAQSTMKKHHKKMHEHMQAMMQCDMGKKMRAKFKKMGCPMCDAKKERQKQKGQVSMKHAPKKQKDKTYPMAR